MTWQPYYPAMSYLWTATQTKGWPSIYTHPCTDRVQKKPTISFKSLHYPSCTTVKYTPVSRWQHSHFCSQRHNTVYPAQLLLPSISILGEVWSLWIFELRRRREHSIKILTAVQSPVRIKRNTGHKVFHRRRGKQEGTRQGAEGVRCRKSWGEIRRVNESKWKIASQWMCFVSLKLSQITPQAWINSTVSWWSFTWSQHSHFLELVGIHQSSVLTWGHWG